MVLSTLLLLSPLTLIVTPVVRLGPRHYPFIASSSSKSSSSRSITTSKMQSFSLENSSVVLEQYNDGSSQERTLLQGEALVQRLHDKQVALYFAAGWCPMCTRFEPALLRFRQEVTASNHKNINAPVLELIYVSSDRTAADQARRVAALQMLSIPFDSTAELKKRYRIWSGSESGTFGSTSRRSGVPALVVLDRDGNELAFLAAESKGVAALQDWPLDDARAEWSR